MTNTTASINAKRAKGTGLTEPLAKRAYDHLGTEYEAIVTIKADSRGDDLSGKEHVNFVITDLEIVSETAAEHVRELKRALFMNRKLHSEDATLPIDTASDSEPTIEGVLAAKGKYEPHAYVDTADAICDVCGDPAGASLHQVLNDDEDPTQAPDPAETEQPAEAPAAATTPDPWEYPDGEGPVPASTVLDPFATTSTGTS